MRTSGILMHIASLPSPYGIGTLGKQAYEFVDFLKQAGQCYWQVLPLTTTSYGDSPYQSFSVFAGNPYFIDLDQLVAEGLLTNEELAPYREVGDATRVDYGWLYEWRYDVLSRAFARFDCDHNPDFSRFCAENAFWLEGYCLFMVIKKHFGGGSFQAWPDPVRNREAAALEPFATDQYQLGFHRFLQYQFSRQFDALKRYANEQGVNLIGDIPIYVAEDSADVWCNSELFLLDENNRLVELAGCPPDAFSDDGQAWGNPIYDWDRMRQEGYGWWIKRVQYVMQQYQLVRIDHFRGFAGYFSYPAGKMPKDGHWNEGPGMELFHALRQALPEMNVIAEDLGFLDEPVHRLLSETGFPGMKVLQFAFDSREQSNYLPHYYTSNCVVYTGTHDNDTVAGWYDTGKPEDVAAAGDYFGVSKKEEYPWAFIRGAWASVADLAIAPMQDFLGLDSVARMNTPATLGGNWAWRMSSSVDLSAIAPSIRRITDLCGRLAWMAGT